MSVLQWDRVGERRYETGVDRGVLYLGGHAVVWNGLTGVEDSTPQSTRAFYQDGVKYLDEPVMGEYEGSLKAFTYPDLFEAALGLASAGNGIYYHDQPTMKFGLTYRTMLGDDVKGLDRGYIIHLLYNLNVSPGSSAHETIADSLNPSQFGWKLTSTPIQIPGRRPTAHLTIRSTQLPSLSLAALEQALYGSASSAPHLPSMQDVIATIENPGQLLSVVDNGDGTWTASGSFLSIKMNSSSEFEIMNSNAEMIDASSYTIPEQ